MRATFFSSSFLLILTTTIMLKSFVSPKTLRVGFGHRLSSASRMIHGRKLQFAVEPMFSLRKVNKCKTCTFSTSSADINLDIISSKSPKEPNQNPGMTNALHTVMVHRNKQSLAFREGTPLVFTKSIAATYTEILGSSLAESSHDG